MTTTALLEPGLPADVLATLLGQAREAGDTEMTDAVLAAYASLPAEDAVPVETVRLRRRAGPSLLTGSDAAWEEGARAEYLAAEEACSYLLSEAGKAKGRDPWPWLWMIPAERAEVYASEELNRWWVHDHPRGLTLAEHRRRCRDEATQERDEERERRHGKEGAVVGIPGAGAVAKSAMHAGGMAAREGARVGVRVAAAQARQGGRPGSAGTVAVREGAVVPHNAPPPATMQSSNPWDGAAALTLLGGFFQHYDYWARTEPTDLMAAFALQCHAIEDDGSPIWRAVGRLIIAAMHGCGKSGTVNQLAMATGTKKLVKVSFAGIRNRIGKRKKPAILDDAQLTFGAGKKSEDVRLVINAHTKGSEVEDGNGEVDVYGQVVMAGLPSLLTGKVSQEIKDTLSRCFVLWKERKPKGLHIPDVSDGAESLLRDQVVPQMREWCMENRDALRARAAEFGAGAPTGLPDLGDGGRANDQLARPLLAVCDVATALVPKHMRDADPSRAWDWSARIRRAIVFVSGVPEPAPVDTEEGAVPVIDRAASALEAMWAAEATVTAASDDEGDCTEDD